MPFDGNGDGLADLLMITSAGKFAIAHGVPAGLGAALNTGIAAPAGTRDFRGADFNGDGLGDIVWSEAADPQVNSLLVRFRTALPGGGFAAPVTLYSQAGAYQNSEGGEFIGRPGYRVDLDGDGAEELLMNENFSIARISDTGHGTEHSTARLRAPSPSISTTTTARTSPTSTCRDISACASANARSRERHGNPGPRMDRPRGAPGPRLERRWTRRLAAARLGDLDGRPVAGRLVRSAPGTGVPHEDAAASPAAISTATAYRTSLCERRANFACDSGPAPCRTYSSAPPTDLASARNSLMAH